MALLDRQSKQLELEIDQFLDAISESAIIFKKGIRDYMLKRHEDFLLRLQDVSVLEAKADQIRRNVEKDLYRNTLIPENRGDVLGILENTDDIIDQIKKTLIQFSVENPEIPEKFNTSFIELGDVCGDAVDSLIRGVRYFFKDFKEVKNHIPKVKFYEREADRLADSLKRDIFRDSIDLSRKNQLRYFTSYIEKISDYAENVADRLAIYAIKREI
ncbi:MAG: DUF47 family protein [Candidatus Cloacimonetes bacterium]|nr:DUF47 family protein [Candidatus Cloacimonadota bacterium]